MSIDALAPRIVAGSALAGFGLSLGRDTYKQTKKNIDGLIIFLFIILVLAFLSTGYSCLAFGFSEIIKHWSEQYSRNSLL